MELTIEQALQQGITAHKEGKLQDAERLYRAILKSQPAHPTANHNLGTIALSSDKAESALPFFKSAVEANPSVGQFWLSYIQALINAKKLDDAQQALDQAKKQGVDAKKLAVLAQKYEKAIIPESPADNPSQEQLSSLFEYYQNGRFAEAEQLAVSITRKFPQHPWSWKVLGLVYNQMGQFGESLTATETFLRLEPQDAEGYSNLGATLKELGRLDDAVSSYNQAISLNGNFTGAHYNLGITLRELGRLDEAEASYTKAIALSPDNAGIHSNLGITLQEQGRLREAEASYRKAIALEPDKADAYYNLGSSLQEQGRLDEALLSYKNALVYQPKYIEALHNVSIVQRCMDDLAAEVSSLEKITLIDPENYGIRAFVNLAICSFLGDDLEGSKNHLIAATKIEERTDPESKNDKTYWKYLSRILDWHELNFPNGCGQKSDQALFIIGESHSLAVHRLRVEKHDSVFLCKAKLIKGCMQWHLGNSDRNIYKYQFERIFSTIPKSSYVLLAIGEIDCRLDSGIIEHKSKFPGREEEVIITKTIENYLSYIVKLNLNYKHAIIIQGVPCPNIDTASFPEKKVAQLIDVIKKFNFELEDKSRQNGFHFLDVYKMTDRGDGLSNRKWHIDKHHLSPGGFMEAWRRYTKNRDHQRRSDAPAS